MNDSGLTELVYEDFVMRLDGPMIEIVGRDFKGIFRLDVNFAKASLTPKKHDRLEVYVDDGGAPRRNADGARRGRPALSNRRGFSRTGGRCGHAQSRSSRAAGLGSKIRISRYSAAMKPSVTVASSIAPSGSK
jgi:hypothetical protein